MAKLAVLIEKIRYTLIMKNILRGVVILVILSLMFSGLAEYAYASIHQDCSCCSNHCQSNDKCHKNTKECLCRYPAPLQVYLLKNDELPKLGCLGSFVPKIYFNYVYLSAEDIFHPPKVSLF